MYKNLLLPLDGSKVAEENVGAAIEFAKMSQGSITLVHVVDLMPFREKDKASEYQSIHDRMEKYLNEVKLKIEKEGINTTTVILKGKPAVEICKYSKRDDVDIILISPTGMGSIMEWALGSVTDKVMRHSSKHVLVFRSKKNI